MPTNCSVKGCGGTGINKSYFTLPAVFKFKQCPVEKANLSKERRKLWLKALGIKDDESATKIRVCSDHFLTGRPAALEDSNNIDWIPSLHMKLPNLVPKKRRRVIPDTRVKTRISVNKIVASKGSARNYGFRRGESKKILNCKVLLDGNLRCTSFNGTNGSGLAIIQKHGQFTSDNVTLRETAINNTVLRVRVIREDLYGLRRKYMPVKQKKRGFSFTRQINRTSASYTHDLAFFPVENLKKVTPAAATSTKTKQGTRSREMHNMSDPVENTHNIKSGIYSKLQNRLTLPRHSMDNTKTLNKVIRRNDKDKIRVKFFPKTSTPIRRHVKNGTIQNTNDTSFNLHTEILFVNQYKGPALQLPTVEEPEVTYYLKFDPTRKKQECVLNYPFQKLVMDVKHMKLPGPSWKIKVIIRQGRISAITFTNKSTLERAVSFTANSNSYKIVIENKPVFLLGAPLHLCCVEDVEVLLNIVAEIDTRNPMLLYAS